MTQKGFFFVAIIFRKLDADSRNSRSSLDANIYGIKLSYLWWYLKKNPISRVRSNPMVI